MKLLAKYGLPGVLGAVLSAQLAFSAEPYVFGRMDVATGTSPSEVVAADLNHDGRQDFAVANNGDNSVSAFLQKSNGTFARATYGVGSQPSAVAVGDFNGDGSPDLVVVNSNCIDNRCGPGSVSILINRGDGTFLRSVSYPTQATGGRAVVVADFNGDGKPDLAVLNGVYGNSGGPGTVSVLLNRGDGTFRYKGTYAAGSGVNGLVAFKAAGIPCLAITNNSGAAGAVAVLRGNGDGSLQPPAFYSAGNGTGGLAAGDLNGDGIPDLAIVSSTASGPVVSVFLGRPDGSFGGKIDYPVSFAPSNVAIGDLNGDRRLDLIVTAGTSEPGGGALAILLGNGDGTFRPYKQYLTGNNPISLVVADFNGDGYPDVAFNNGDVFRVSILLGNGDGSFPAASTMATGVLPIAIATGDLDGDGWPDLAVANSGADTVSIYLNNGKGAFTLAHSYVVGREPKGVILDDFNGDHRLDLVVTNSGDNTISVLLGNGNGTFLAPKTYSVGSAPYGLAAADLNGDHNLDVAVVNFNDDTISVLMGNGDGTFQAPTTYVTAAGPSSVAIGDFNGDGRPDLAVADSETPIRLQDPGLVSVFLNQGNGTFGGKTDYAAGYHPQSVIAVDLNHDGKQDLALATNLDSTGLVAVLLGNGDGSFQPQTTYREGFIIYALTAGDFNNDGNPDLAVTSGQNDTVFILAGDGHGGFQIQGSYGTGEGGVSIAAGNFSPKAAVTGPDLVIANFYSNSLSVFLNTQAHH